MISYDEQKRLSNIAKHGIDFNDCLPVFDNPMVSNIDDRYAYGEQRIQSYGILNDCVVCMVWVERDVPHIISVRKADKNEVKRYIQAIYG